MIFVGCDPGKEGYLAVIDHTGEPFANLATPYLDDIPDVLALDRWMENVIADVAMTYGPGSIHAAIEHVNSFGMGRQSAFVFGGAWMAMRTWATLHPSFTSLRLVTPKVWQKSMFEGLPKAKDRNDKDIRAVLYTKRRWPSVNLTPGRCTVPKDGLADALCIAEWLRREVMR